MRIKLPKLLVKIMRKRKAKKCNHVNGDGNIVKGKREQDGMRSSNGSGMEEAITVIQSFLEGDKCQKGDNNEVRIDDQTGVQKVVPRIGKPTSRSFREMLHKVGNFNGRKDSVGKQVMNKGKKSSIFNKVNASKTSNCNAIIPSVTSRDTNGSRNQKCSKVMPGSPNIKPRSYHIRQGRESARKRIKTPKEEANTMELCKKRILMGKRCRSLNRSGSLQYDEKGILLPEEIIPAEDI